MHLTVNQKSVGSIPTLRAMKYLIILNILFLGCSSHIEEPTLLPSTSIEDTSTSSMPSITIEEEEVVEDDFIFDL